MDDGSRKPPFGYHHSYNGFREKSAASAKNQWMKVLYGI